MEVIVFQEQHSHIRSLVVVGKNCTQEFEEIMTGLDESQFATCVLSS